VTHRSAADLRKRRRLAPVALALVAINGALGTYGIWRTYHATRLRRQVVERIASGSLKPDAWGVVRLDGPLRSAADGGTVAVTRTEAATWVILPHDRDGASVTAYLWCSNPGSLQSPGVPLLRVPQGGVETWVRVDVQHVDGPNWARVRYTLPRVQIGRLAALVLGG
jgi:hypothetical protein